MKTYPKTLAAVKAANLDQWAIGDALVEECGPPSETGVQDGSRNKIKEAAEYLLTYNFEYKIETLAHFRETAYDFKESVRLPSISFSVHRAAGSPEFLKSVIQGAPKGTRITQAYIEGIKQRLMDEARREREAAAQKAEKEREEAEREEAKTRAKAEKASKHEKPKAEAEVAEAVAKTKAAKQKEKKVRTAPIKRSRLPEKDEVPILAIQSEFIADAAYSVKMARLNAKRIREMKDELTAKGITALTEAALEAANAWTEAARIVRSEMVNESGHLSIVGE
jgi:hypothetical protein